MVKNSLVDVEDARVAGLIPAGDTRDTGLIPGLGRILPGKSQGQKSLVGCRLWGRTELDMTEAT